VPNLEPQPGEREEEGPPKDSKKQGKQEEAKVTKGENLKLPV
jgi:hypothetical protein